MSAGVSTCSQTIRDSMSRIPAVRFSFSRITRRYSEAFLPSRGLGADKAYAPGRRGLLRLWAPQRIVPAWSTRSRWGPERVGRWSLDLPKFQLRIVRKEEIVVKEVTVSFF